MRCAATRIPGVSDETIHHLYQNQVLPLALSRLGKLVLHASAVEVDGEGIVFVGESGRGKSTLAASFATGGYRFMTDDGLVIEEEAAGYLVLPSHPSIRLWEDSQEALIHPAAPAAAPVQYTSKTRFLAGGDIAFCGEPRPLGRVYFLSDRQSPDVAFDRMDASDALIELVKHSFLLDIEAPRDARVALRSTLAPGGPAHLLPPRLPAAVRHVERSPQRHCRPLPWMMPASLSPC